MDEYRVNARTLYKDWPLILIILAMFAASAALYPYLPDPMPSHWNIHGQVDGYSAKPVGAFLPPALTLGIYLLMVFLPVIDPRRANYLLFSGAYRALRVGLVLFMASLQLIAFSSALGYPVQMERFMPVILGLLVIVIGNYLTQVRHNYFIGIRTPWTLADEEVWRKTHRFSGPLFVAAGVLCLVSAFLPAAAAFAVSISAIIGVSIISVLYSLIIFKRNPK